MFNKTFIDLFCGIGGFRLGLERHGLKCVFSSDINNNSSYTYFKNFNEVNLGNIINIHEKDIPKMDIICGGFPCQSFSKVGLKKGFNDNRGMLIFEIIRIAKYHQPNILFLENVEYILKINNGNVIKKIVKELENINYRVHYKLLNSSLYGIPQNRKRVYFFCIRKDLIDKCEFNFPKPTFEKIYLKNIIDNNINEKSNKELYIKRRFFYLKTRKNAKYKLYSYKDDISKIDNKFKNELKTIRIGHYNLFNGQGSGIFSIKGHSPCILTEKMESYLINGKIRKLSINELKKVMGFPNDFILPNNYNNSVFQLGNAVIPEMIYKIYKGLNVLDPLKMATSEKGGKNGKVS